MGKRYKQHSDMCGCSRCAAKADRGDFSPTFDVIDDPNMCDCGAFERCDGSCMDDGPYRDDDEPEAA